MSNQNGKNEKARKTKPDYDHWSKYDKWDFKEAALLLHGLEPSNYLKVRFNSKEVPSDPNLKEAHKVFLVLKKCNGFEYGSSAHPIKILTVANEKDLKIPKELLDKFVARNARQNEIRKKTISQHQSTESNNEFSTRERNVFLKALAIMAHMLAKNAVRLQVNNRPNPHQISLAILEKAESMRANTDGLKSLNRKITEALLFLEEGKEYDSKY